MISPRRAEALHEASVWLDDLNNRPEQCDIVSKPNFINCQKEIILGRLQGKLDYVERKLELQRVDVLPLDMERVQSDAIKRVEASLTTRSLLNRPTLRTVC